jgi:hypothetical protein
MRLIALPCQEIRVLDFRPSPASSEFATARLDALAAEAKSNMNRTMVEPLP